MQAFSSLQMMFRMNESVIQDVVIFRDGAELTLEQVFQSLKLTAYDLSIDTLDMHAHQDSFHRFDKFNLKYNPIGESRLREIFLKTDNYIKGRYLAELTQGMLSRRCLKWNRVSQTYQRADDRSWADQVSGIITFFLLLDLAHSHVPERGVAPQHIWTICPRVG